MIGINLFKPTNHLENLIAVSNPLTKKKKYTKFTQIFSFNFSSFTSLLKPSQTLKGPMN